MNEITEETRNAFRQLKMSKWRKYPHPVDCACFDEPPQRCIHGIACTTECLECLDGLILEQKTGVRSKDYPSTPRTQYFAFNENRRDYESGALIAPSDTEWLEFCQQLERHVEICEKDHILKFDHDRQVADITSERDENQANYQNAMDKLREKREHLDEQRKLHHAAAEELAAVKEALWPDQTGLPNEHRNAALAIVTIKKLHEKHVAESDKVLGMAFKLNLDLQNKADMWRDEFERIKAIEFSKPGVVESEIAGICDRAMLDIRSNISLIDQREKVAEENADLRADLSAISDFYNILRHELVERNAKELHGIYQSAAKGKPLDFCREEIHIQLRCTCIGCGGTGTRIEVEQGAQYEVACEQCEGAQYVEIPDLSWLKNGKVQFSLLPKNHPDYDPTR